MSITYSMISICTLVAVALLVSDTPQSRGIGLSFPGEYDAGTDYYGGDYGTDDGTNYDGGIEEFYDSPDKKIYLPDGDSDYESYDDDSEPSTFVNEEDHFELPDWMNLDFNELPLDKLELLNNASDLTDLAAFFDLDPKNADKLSEPLTNGTDQTESRSAGVVEKNYENTVFAQCEPEKVKVVLKVEKSTGYLPSCVRLKRCGGCCHNELLSCQPTKSEVISLRVLKISMGNSFRSNRGKISSGGRRRGRRTSGTAAVVYMPQENHSECSCQCKVQERHCDLSVHKYNKDVCACLCKDEVKKTACLRNSGLQTWDSKSCTCKCRTVKQCGNGELFSQDTCRCRTAPRF